MASGYFWCIALLAAARGSAARPGSTVVPGSTSPPLAPRIFEPLPLGAIAPEGWLLEQLVRQAGSLSGYLSFTQNLGGYHGDSNVVNATKWLGGRGGGPSYISSNDQWFPYWANGNVPLVSLLRAAGALGRIPANLPLEDIIDSSMRYVLSHADPKAGFDVLAGALTAGGDIDQANVTVAAAEARCASNPSCLGFTFQGSFNASSATVRQVFFKSKDGPTNSDRTWTTCTKRTGWLSGHLLSEGGTQIVMALTQWSEDRPLADRRAVAKACIAHLLYVAAFISPATVQSWAATRWASVNTLLNYALDKLIPEFAGDRTVLPRGAANTTATLLDGAHRMGRVGFDYEAYYGGKPNPRSANKSLPNGSVPIWNVYDHGVNNAEGALRWPSEVYRLNRSLEAGVAAMDLLLSGLDKWQAQVQGTFCADEVFCGRDPERGTETCTVVETMASYEHSFASLGYLPLQDRVERLAFNALPAALTGDMWTHVYVQQANSVYAGVTHPKSTRGSHHHHHRGHRHEHLHEHLRGDGEHQPSPTPRYAGDAARRAARSCPRGLCAGGGPAAFSEIQDTNYFGTSHFPCCITNFPQGWPKFAQSAVLTEAATGAVVIASLVPLTAKVPVRVGEKGGAGADAATVSLQIDTSYPFGDSAKITVTLPQATKQQQQQQQQQQKQQQQSSSSGSSSPNIPPVVVKIRIPGWATRATVDGKPAPNGTLVMTTCSTPTTTISVELAPEVRVERGWGDTLQDPPAAAVAVTRGPLVFALHPAENKTVVRRYQTVPATAGEMAPDYLITTGDEWEYALDLGPSAAKPAFVAQPSKGWSPTFAFDDGGVYPFGIDVVARPLATGQWGYWRGSNITAPPPVSPLDKAKSCPGPPTVLRLVPFGSTNIRISVFPFVQ